MHFGGLWLQDRRFLRSFPAHESVLAISRMVYAVR